MSAYSAQYSRGFLSAVEVASSALLEHYSPESELDHARKVQEAFNVVVKFVPDLEEGIVMDAEMLVENCETISEMARSIRATGNSMLDRAKRHSLNNEIATSREVCEAMYDSLRQAISVCRTRALAQQGLAPLTR